jgi:hypothetical protein
MRPVACSLPVHVSSDNKRRNQGQARSWRLFERHSMVEEDPLERSVRGYCHFLQPPNGAPLRLMMSGLGEIVQ